MFYLLEDNRIIDSNNLRKDLPFEINIGIKGDKVCYSSDVNGLELNTIKIKNQSENVFDLVEKDDLIKSIFGEIMQVLSIRKDYYCNISKKQIHLDFITHTGGVADTGLYLINAIYKPNSKGDYIKVWERKGE